MNKNNIKTLTCLSVSAGAGMLVSSALRNNATPNSNLQAGLMFVGSIAIAGVAGEAARRWTSDTWDVVEMKIETM